MYRSLKVTRCGYYAWKKRDNNRYAIQDELLKPEIKSIFEKSRGTYGSPRILQALRQEGIRTSGKRVARLMRELGLRARSVRVYRREPGRHKYFTSVPNRLRKCDAILPNQAWVGDITYVRSGGKKNQWSFLAVVMDRCSRKIIGWAMSSKRDVHLTLKSLNSAVKNRKLKKAEGLIFHSDRGNEYGAHIFRKRLKQLGIIQSMNRPRRMTDNANMESFFHSFKSDCYHQARFSNYRQLRAAIKKYLPFYNQERIHSSIGYLSPVQFEANLC
jgi:transposase InsO family protein